MELIDSCSKPAVQAHPHIAFTLPRALLPIILSVYLHTTGI